MKASKTRTANEQWEMREMHVWERMEVHSPMHTVRMPPERPCFCMASRLGMPVLCAEETECKDEETEMNRMIGDESQPKQLPLARLQDEVARA